MTNADAIRFVLTARAVNDIFPDSDSAEKTYRELAMLVHPDAVNASSKTEAESAFVKLTKFYQELNGKSEPFPAMKIGHWVVTAPLASGDMADLYCATNEKRDEVVFKIARLPRDNDLMEAEASNLKALWADGSTDNFKKYLPQVFENVRASGRAANVLARAGISHYSLMDILQRFPAGLDFRHIVWMMNRLLAVLGCAHRTGFVHGAVLPQHLLYQIEDHGLMLVDWCYSVPRGKIVKAIVSAQRASYPFEILGKKSVDASTDIFMAARAMINAAGTIPSRFQGLLEDWCLADSPKARPHDAWELQERWIQLAEKEYGPPKYVRLEMPPPN